MLRSSYTRGLRREFRGSFSLATPTFAVEVALPADTMCEMIAKVLDYLRAGTRMAWMIYPSSRTVMVYRSFEDIRMGRVRGCWRVQRS